jgi:hypothetical protein
MLAKRKLALLRVAKARLHLCEDDYRAILESCGGRRSTSELDDRGFDAVMNRFRSLGFVSNQRDKDFGERYGMASAAQLDLIRKLWAELASDPTERSLGSWMEQHFGVSALRFLNRKHAYVVIGALRKWQERVADDV